MGEVRNKPSRVYKYQPADKVVLDNLKQQGVYFSSPCKFNDPYDCGIYPKVIKATEEEMMVILDQLKHGQQFSEQARKELMEYEGEGIVDRLLQGAEDVMSSQIDKFRLGYGISCFSSRNDDLLMWAHYGGRYKGVCLEFSTDTEILSNILPVEYSDTIPSYSFRALMFDEPSKLAFSKLFLSKSKSWEYETEWRSFCEKPDRLIKYNTEDLVGLYLGPDIDHDTMDRVVEVSRSQYPKIKLYRGARSRTFYKVEFVEIE